MKWARQLAISAFTLLCAAGAGGAADLGGLTLGGPMPEDFEARENCKFVRMEYDKRGYWFTDRYDMETLERIVRDHSNDPLKFDGNRGQKSAPFFVGRYICEDRRYYIVSTELISSKPARIAGVTVLYCAGNEAKGAEVIANKLGAPVEPKANSLFNPESVVGKDLQAPERIAASSVDPDIFIRAYKKPDGCNVENYSTAYLYALTFHSTSMYRELRKEQMWLEERRKNEIRPPKRL